MLTSLKVMSLAMQYKYPVSGSGDIPTQKSIAPFLQRQRFSKLIILCPFASFSTSFMLIAKSSG
jgi:hypothetical protein